MSDDQLVNHGEYTEYYPNGQKFAEGNYDNGVHDGTWSYLARQRPALQDGEL